MGSDGQSQSRAERVRHTEARGVAEASARLIARSPRLIEAASDEERRAQAAILFSEANDLSRAIANFGHYGFDPAEIGLLLDAQDIHVRTGFHCAPRVFPQLPEAAAGLVRVSFGPFNSEDDVRALTRALPVG